MSFLSNKFPWRPSRNQLRISDFIGISRIIIGVLGVFITSFALFSIYKVGEQATVRHLEDLAFVITRALEEPLAALAQGDSDPQEIESLLNRYLVRCDDVRYGILLADGRELPFESKTRSILEISMEGPEIEAALSNTIGHSIRVDDEGQKGIFAAAPVRNGDRLFGVLVLFMPLNPALQQAFHAMGWVSLISMGIGILLIIEGCLDSSFLTQPLISLSETAEALSHGDLTARAEPEGPREVSYLANTLNVMASRLQASLNSMKEFVANASHELRTPLTAMKLQIGALRDGALDEPEVARRFLYQLECEVDRLSRLVNELLDLSQIESAANSFDFQAVDLTELAHEVQAFWAVRVKQAGLELAIRSPKDLPEAKGDPYQLRRVFENLIENAIKYTPPGGRIDIVLSSSACSGGDGASSENRLRVEVRDTGIGILPEHLPHIFDRFYRVEKAKAGPLRILPRQSDGKTPCEEESSGLGLAIARSIVQAHGGQIGANSLYGSGSTFWFELPSWY